MEGNNRLIVELYIENGELVIEYFPGFGVFNRSVHHSAGSLTKLNRSVHHSAGSLTKLNWKAAAAKISDLRDRIFRCTNTDFHIFPKIPTSLAIYFGFKLQNAPLQVYLYQYNETDGWSYNNPNVPKLEVTSLFFLRSKGSLVVDVSFDSVISISEMQKAVGHDSDLLTFSLKSLDGLERNCRSNTEDIKLSIKKQLDEIHSNYSEIHIFVSAPILISLEIGRIIRERMYPDTFVYDYDADSIHKYSGMGNIMDIIN